MISRFLVFNKNIQMDSRSKKALAGIFVSVFLKIISVFVSFISIPIILDFVSKETFGIWLAITSSFAFVNVLDIGFGDGLRNKYAESKAENNIRLAKAYVSTTYFVNLVLTTLFIVAFYLIEKYISWHKIFNLSAGIEAELKQVAKYILLFTSVQFFLQAVLNLIKGDQKFALASTIAFFLNISSLSVVVVFTKADYSGSLINLVIAYFIVPNFLLLVISLYLFLTNYKEVVPSIAFVKREYIKSLSFLSFKFFLINITTVIAFQSINLIIIREFSSEAVTNFNLLYRYYFILISIAYIAFNPLWSSFTDAIIKKDIQWIESLLKKCTYISFLMILIVPILIIFSECFIFFWTKKPFHASFHINVLFGLWISLIIISEPLKMFLKGAGILSNYVLLSFLIMLIQIVVSIFLIRTLKFDVSGVLIGIILSQFIQLLFLMKMKDRILKSLKSTLLYKSSNDNFYRVTNEVCN